MKYHQSVYLYLSSILLVAACKKDSIQPETVTQIFPNTVGCQWEYSIYDSSYSDGISNMKTLNVEIVDTLQFSSGETASVWFFQTDTLRDTLYVIQSGDSVRVYGDGDQTAPEWAFGFPFVLGTGWGTQNDTTYVAPDEVSVSLPGGNFDHCFLITNEKIGVFEFSLFNVWFVNEVGVVRTRHTDGTWGPADPLIYKISELIDFHIEY